MMFRCSVARELSRAIKRNVQPRWCSSASLKAKCAAGPSLEHFLTQANAACVQGSEASHPYLNVADTLGNDRNVFFETYGCQMNVNDTEIAWSILKNAGFKRTHDENKADVILIMTCAIREGAESKIWRRLKYLRGLKTSRNKSSTTQPPLQIGVLGCMAERLKEKLLEQEKSVDLIAGPDSYRDLPRLLAFAKPGQAGVNVMLSLDETYADIMPVRMNPESKSAFVSIMRGCNNMCTYCIVPFTRGRERSRPLTSILEEIRALSDQGIKEVTLLGQNVNSYRDTSKESVSLIECPRDSKSVLSSGFKTVYKLPRGGLRFVDLLDKASLVDPEMRIRFTSPHPKDFPDEVLQVIKDRPNICNHIHLPAQSGSTQVLQRMNRGYTREAYLDLVDHIRSLIPEVSLTSDFICGFCGETEDAHNDTVSLVNSVEYTYAFVFPYSMREKTRAYHRLKDDVPHEVKSQRVYEVLQTFRSKASELHTRKIGTKQLVLVEGASKRSQEDFAGRNDGNTKVIFPHIPIPEKRGSEKCRQISPGDYIVVQVQSCSSQTLRGMPLHHTTLQEFHQ